MSARTPFDGKPYYCAVCGLGLGEFYACEEPDCRLENDAMAQERKRTLDDAVRQRKAQP